MNPKTSPRIGTLNEGPLHEAIKKWYARPKDKFEVPVEKSVVDIVRGKQLIEIQTRNFSAIRRKLEKLLVNHKVRLVYPIAEGKWIIKEPKDVKDKAARRRSPKRGCYEDVFNELIRIPHLLINPNFSLELLLIEEEEVRRYDGFRGWRRGFWVTEERRLLTVVESRVFNNAADIVAFLPEKLREPFTVKDVTAATLKPRRLARKMVYCLNKCHCIEQSGKSGNAILYTRCKPPVIKRNRKA
jgi:uncharacterized protein YbaR (Trm112 family)